MIHKLIHPFKHKDENYTEIKLPDALQLGHQLASMRAARHTAEKSAGIKVDLSSLDDAMPSADVFRMLEVNLEYDKAMIETFSEDFPADAIDELAIDDVEVINAHIRRLLSRDNKDNEAEPAKKPTRPAPSA